MTGKQRENVKNQNTNSDKSLKTTLATITSSFVNSLEVAKQDHSSHDLSESDWEKDSIRYLKIAKGDYIIKQILKNKARFSNLNNCLISPTEWLFEKENEISEIRFFAIGHTFAHLDVEWKGVEAFNFRNKAHHLTDIILLSATGINSTEWSIIEYLVQNRLDFMFKKDGDFSEKKIKELIELNDIDSLGKLYTELFLFCFNLTINSQLSPNFQKSQLEKISTVLKNSILIAGKTFLQILPQVNFSEYIKTLENTFNHYKGEATFDYSVQQLEEIINHLTHGQSIPMLNELGNAFKFFLTHTHDDIEDGYRQMDKIIQSTIRDLLKTNHTN
jgi:hypothetical protein